MNQFYYITLKPDVLNVKMGRAADKKYLVVGQPTLDKVEFINDNNEFDAVDKHKAWFAGIYEPMPNVKETVKVTEPLKGGKK